MATKAKSNKSKVAQKGKHLNVILCSVIGTILVFTIAGALVAMPSAMRFKHRKEIFSQLDLGNKGFSYTADDNDTSAVNKNNCKISSRPDDKSVTYCLFTYPASVSQTADKIKSIAKDSGWKFVRNSSKEDSAALTFVFKNSRGNYLTISLTSRPRDEALINASIMGRSDLHTEALNMDINAAPTNVIVSLNLSKDEKN